MQDIELISLVEENFHEKVTTVLQACEVFYLNGAADEVSGDVDCPTGHFYRLKRWIVFTDNIGTQTLINLGSEEAAKVAFDNLDKEYGEWLEEENESTS